MHVVNSGVLADLDTTSDSMGYLKQISKEPYEPGAADGLWTSAGDSISSPDQAGPGLGRNSASGLDAPLFFLANRTTKLLLSKHGEFPPAFFVQVLRVNSCCKLETRNILMFRYESTPPARAAAARPHSARRGIPAVLAHPEGTCNHGSLKTVSLTGGLLSIGPKSWMRIFPANLNVCDHYRCRFWVRLRLLVVHVGRQFAAIPLCIAVTRANAARAIRCGAGK